MLLTWHCFTRNIAIDHPSRAIYFKCFHTVIVSVWDFSSFFEKKETTKIRWKNQSRNIVCAKYRATLSLEHSRHLAFVWYCKVWTRRIMKAAQAFDTLTIWSVHCFEVFQKIRLEQLTSFCFLFPQTRHHT